jgi:hypothetical protein
LAGHSPNTRLIQTQWQADGWNQIEAWPQREGGMASSFKTTSKCPRRRSDASRHRSERDRGERSPRHKVEAFKVIAVLPRIYRESYATHGLSLEPDRIRT